MKQIRDQKGRFIPAPRPWPPREAPKQQWDFEYQLHWTGVALIGIGLVVFVAVLVS